jgi:hypothetical protein
VTDAVANEQGGDLAALGEFSRSSIGNTETETITVDGNTASQDTGGLSVRWIWMAWYSVIKLIWCENSLLAGTVCCFVPGRN